MCGISGILYRDPSRPVDSAVLKAMADQIAHRGPDAEGFFNEPPVGLAHRRLSIIDLEGGRQPLGNEDGSIQVVFNGEIYNYRELRRELQTKGHRFATRSDTEVLVHLYEEMGERLVERLRGMFAFALWDHRRRQLLLARDRVGLKPLYYYWDGEKFLFGSEIKALLAHPDIDDSIDLQALEDYLTFGVIPAPRSIYRRIRKLPPAHTLVVSQENFAPPPQRYWQLEGAPDYSKSSEEWAEILRAKLTETIQAHQISDVPVGAFLSGGLDSSAMVWEMARQDGQNLKTFSMGFNERKFSELPFARQVAQQMGTDHIDEVVTPGAAQSLEDLVTHYDEPFADASAVPTMQVARLAREHVKVVISGDGGDEAFGGYSRYAHDLVEHSLRKRLPTWFRRWILSSVAGAWPKVDWLPRILRAKTALTNLSLDAADAYANTLSLCPAPLRRRLLNSNVVQSLNGYRPQDKIIQAFHRGQEPLQQMISSDVEVLLPDDFLVKVDRASMAVGLEVRPPLVDHEFLELSAQIPSDQKIRRGETKRIFKQLYQDRLPHDIIWRKKQGFEIPIDDWLRGPLRDAFYDTVLSPNAAVASFIDQSTAAALYRAHQNRIGRHGNLLWALLVLGKWTEHNRPLPANSSNVLSTSIS